MTQRSYSSLRALLSDGKGWFDWLGDGYVPGGGVPPGFLVDLLDSVRTASGGFYVSTAAATTISDTDVFVKTAGTTLATPNLYLFDMPADNRLRYTGTSPREVHVTATIGAAMDGTNDVTRWRVYVFDDSAGSGETKSPSEVTAKIAASGDVVGVALQYDLEMHENDYVEIWCANETAADNITAQTMTVFAASFFV